MFNLTPISLSSAINKMMDEIKVGDPYNQLGFLLIQVSWLKQRLNATVFKDLNITYVQFVIMAAIYEKNQKKQSVTQQTLVNERQLDKAMVSSVVKGLVARKFITRREHPDDKRAMFLKLTAAGIQRIHQAKERLQVLDGRFFENIDQEHLRGSLITLLSHSDKKL